MSNLSDLSHQELNAKRSIDRWFAIDEWSPVIVIDEKEIQAKTLTIRKGRDVQYNKTLDDIIALYKNVEK